MVRPVLSRADAFQVDPRPAMLAASVVAPLVAIGTGAEQAAVLQLRSFMERLLSSAENPRDAAGDVLYMALTLTWFSSFQNVIGEWPMPGLFLFISVIFFYHLSSILLG